MNKWIIEHYDINNINEEDLNLFHWIERDTWAYFLWEYVQCSDKNDCWKVFSKSDIYKNKDINFDTFTIIELEKKYGTEIDCPCCWWNVDFLRGDEYKQSIIERLENSIDSTIAVYKNNIGEICWFSHWYVDTFENIAKREFQYKFSEELLIKFEKISQELFHTVFSTCIYQKDQDLSILFDLLKWYFHYVDNQYLHLPGVTDAIVWSPTFKIYQKSWAQALELYKKWSKYYKNDCSIQTEKINDILIHNNPVISWKNYYNDTFKMFLKKTSHNKNKIFTDIQL